MRLFRRYEVLKHTWLALGVAVLVVGFGIVFTMVQVDAAAQNTQAATKGDVELILKRLDTIEKLIVEMKKTKPADASGTGSVKDSVEGRELFDLTTTTSYRMQELDKKKADLQTKIIKGEKKR